jgi:hypothetical protein
MTARLLTARARRNRQNLKEECQREPSDQDLVKSQPSRSRSEASARKKVDLVREWDLGVTSPLKVLQNA